MRGPDRGGWARSARRDRAGGAAAHWRPGCRWRGRSSRAPTPRPGRTPRSSWSRARLTLREAYRGGRLVVDVELGDEAVLVDLHAQRGRDRDGEAGLGRDGPERRAGPETHRRVEQGVD